MTNSHVAGAPSCAPMEDEQLPKCEWQYWLIQGDQIVVGHYIRRGYLGHSVFAIADLPNDFVTAADLEALRISLARGEDGRPVFKLHLPYNTPTR